MGWKDQLKKAPQKNRAEIFVGRIGDETEDSFKFSIDGEVIVSVGKSQILAKGLNPVSDTKELYDLMLEFFKIAKEGDKGD